jgi:uncharacterized membrane protein YraQ (UPF0718 family)
VPTADRRDPSTTPLAPETDALRVFVAEDRAPSGYARDVSAVPAPSTDVKPARATGLVWVYLGAFLLSTSSFSNLSDWPALENWSTIFLSLTLQALPFLVLGVVVSAALSAFVAPGALARLVPRTPIVSVPTAALAGAALPGCECSSVPVAGRLVSRGVPPAAALTFLLAAPALNPVVLVSTSVAFPGRPEMVLARFIASFLAATTVGFVWTVRHRNDQLATRMHEHSPGRALDRFSSTLTHDFVQAGGFLVLGAMLVATLQTAVPASLLDDLGGGGLIAVASMAALAVVLSVCSEADAFVAAGLVQFSLTSRLVFLTVGPMVDLKLVALQAGTFGRSFAARFAPLTFAVAVLSAVVIGWVLL